MTKAEQRRLAAKAAQNHAITVLPPGVACAPSHEPDDNDALREAAEALLAEQTAAALALAEGQEHTQPPAPAAPRQKSGFKGWAKSWEVFHNDDAVIEWVAPNPKKQGSASYARFANYAVGRTLAECKKLGTTAGDILWDLPRGFIRLVPGTTK